MLYYHISLQKLDHDATQQAADKHLDQSVKNLLWASGYDRSTDQTDKSADLSEFADYRYYRSDKPLYRIGIGSADYKGPYRLIGMGIKRAHIGANLVKFEPLKYI